MSDLIAHWVPSFLAAGALVVAVIVAVKYKIPNLVMRVTGLESKSHDEIPLSAEVVTKAELYDEDGKPTYQRRDGCADLHKHICAKIDEVKIVVSADTASIKKDLMKMDADRNDARVEMIQLQKDMVAVTTQVRDMFQLKHTEDLQALANLILKKMNGRHE